ncbi:MAG: NADAR family protein [Rhodospirillales bacterium]|nr:NADAR family protein [Rhodospirillales bacterium]
MNPTRPAASPAPEHIDRFRGELAFLSNFHYHPFEWRGRTYSTSEHAFQSAKSRDDRERQRIRAASSPAEAKRLGRRADLRCDWDRIKDDVMHSVLLAKFAVPALRDALLATGDAELVEGNTWGDVYWGVCGGRGRNQLGRTLMRIRDDIRRRAGPAMDAQHADWLRERCDVERAGRCERDVCHRRGGWRHDAGGEPSCIPLEILRRLERAEADRPDPTAR